MVYYKIVLREENMAKRILNKDLLKEIEELKKEGYSQKFVSFSSIALAYILVGISMIEYFKDTSEAIGLGLIIIGISGFIYGFCKLIILPKYRKK